ncbi:MAG TPA: hypothetical protein VG818_10965 [Gemmatimonadaceae bacterium]|nr:hypothetical protein [Gemmatimonadaceae bacterium]
MRRALRRGGVALAMAGALALPLHAQGVIIRGSSSAQLVDLRPVVTDSVPFASTDSISGTLRRTPAGVITNCLLGDRYCYFSRSAARTSLVAMMQDLDITAWGLGQGISVHAQLRGRAATGDARDLWPQATQSFDALSAYLELDRQALTARVGRQWITSGLGMFNMDGADLVVRPWRWLAVEAYGGGTLIQGLDRPLGAAALAPVEDIPPVERSFLAGGSVQVRPGPLGAFRVQYQREVRNDRGALYSDRLAADAEMRLGRATVGGELTRDLAAGVFDDLAAHVGTTLGAQVSGQLEVRHYTPYFDLWTIWGAFAPVGYDEATARIAWTRRDARLSIGMSGGARRYNETHTGLSFLPLRNDGWRAGANATARMADAWSLEGSYNIDLGFGASTTDGDAALRWSPSDRGSLAVRGMAFQDLYEFTIGEGRVVGIGLEGRVDLTPELAVAGDANLFRHAGKDQPQLADWNQRRASLRLEWRVGREPGWGLGGVHAP